MINNHILNELKKGFEQYELPYVVTESADDSAFVVKFNGANDCDCLLLIVGANKELEVHKVTGPTIARRSFDYGSIDEDFFSMLKENYETVKKLILLRSTLHSALVT